MSDAEKLAVARKALESIGRCCALNGDFRQTILETVLDALGDITPPPEVKPYMTRRPL